MWIRGERMRSDKARISFGLNLLTAAFVLPGALWPTLAGASGGFGCSGGEILCVLGLWNAGMGLMLGGVPISIALFVGVHLYLRRPGWPRLKRAFAGAVHGLLVFDIAVVVAAIIVPWMERNTSPAPGQPASFILTFVMIGVASVLYILVKRDAMNAREKV
jgi:hypothetical protein